MSVWFQHSNRYTYIQYKYIVIQYSKQKKRTYQPPYSCIYTHIQAIEMHIQPKVEAFFLEFNWKLICFARPSNFILNYIAGGRDTQRCARAQLMNCKCANIQYVDDFYILCINVTGVSRKYIDIGPIYLRIYATRELTLWICN